MRRLLVVLALAGVLTAAGGATVLAASSRVTLRITGRRARCSVDRRRVRSCRRMYRLRAGQALTIRTRARRRGAAGGNQLADDGHRHPRSASVLTRPPSRSTVFAPVQAEVTADFDAPSISGKTSEKTAGHRPSELGVRGRRDHNFRPGPHGGSRVGE